MEALLGDELPAFTSALREPPVRGLRINPSKVGAGELAALLGVELTPVPWCPGTGFVLPLDGFVMLLRSRTISSPNPMIPLP